MDEIRTFTFDKMGDHVTAYSKAYPIEPPLTGRLIIRVCSYGSCAGSPVSSLTFIHGLTGRAFVSLDQIDTIHFDRVGSRERKDVEVIIREETVAPD